MWASRLGMTARVSLSANASHFCGLRMLAQLCCAADVTRLWLFRIAFVA
jgi:hypothetical protein